jgi:VIT1/CCC1 family predicted Fe2+/Mn2+ transporter
LWQRTFLVDFSWHSRSLAGRRLHPLLAAAHCLRVRCRPGPHCIHPPLCTAAQACWTSGLSFSFGAVVPLLAGAFIPSWRLRIACVCVATVLMLMAIGSLAAHLGGAHRARGSIRVLVGGSVAMAVT